MQAVRLNKWTAAGKHSQETHRSIEVDRSAVQRWQLIPSEQGRGGEDAANGDRGQHQRRGNWKTDCKSAQRQTKSRARSMRKKRKPANQRNHKDAMYEINQPARDCKRNREQNDQPV